MALEVKYNYDADKGIFIKYYYGEVQLQDIFNSWEQVIQNGIIPDKVKRFIINYKEASINFPSHRVADIADFYIKHDSVFANSKIAMVMESPDQVVFPHLMVLQKITFKIETFYTMDAAIHWLMKTL